MNSDKKTAIIFGISIVIAIAAISSVLSFFDQNTSEIEKSEMEKIPNHRNGKPNWK